ncbi:MAG: hypothetical protein HMLKMBBP_02515 [Planctomycetes bacterium]|nr:hypothetical protein [Planctomycetota bacterium]
MRALALLLLAAAALPARGDTVVLVGGKKLEGVTVSRNDSEWVVVNPWNSRHPDMTWEIPDKFRFPRAKVEEVIIADPPAVEWRRRTASKLSADERRELAKFCEQHKLADEAAREKALAKMLDDEKALADLLAEAGAEPAPGAKPDPDLDATLRRLEREYVKLADPAELDAQWKRMTERGTTRARPYLERARRSAALPRGRRDKVPLTVRSTEASGATYCIVVPQGYDPLVPTPLVIGLHGGGQGGVNGELVTGSGEDAMPFYEQLAEQWGWIVVCPTARRAPWSNRENEAWMDALFDEMTMLFNVDESRVYLTGHSMGGFGTWHWGPARAERWAAISPCAGGGGPNGVDAAGLPVYVYHGSDDHIVGPGSDRSAAKALLANEKAKKRPDAVYTELDGQKHGFPDWVREDIFRFFAGRTNDRMKRKGAGPVSSFHRKATKEEIRCFGDPAAAPAAAGGEDAKLADLVAKLERGGGSAAEAAEELGKRKDPATAKALARVVKSAKAAPDVRVAAAAALGSIATPEALAALAPVAADDDFKVVDQVVASIGRIGGAASVEPLSRAARKMGAFFDASIQGGQLVFTEYEVRCRSFGRLCDALAACGDAAAASALLEKEVVARVFTPKSAYDVPVDERFTHIPPRARADLAARLRAALDKLGAPRKKEILAPIAAAWSREAEVVRACTVE